MLKEGVDYIINSDGNLVFTREYHLKRGYCCKNQCLNCPWNYKGDKQNKQPKNK